MALDLNGFVSPQTDYAGLYKAGDTLLRKKEHEEMSQFRRESRQAATTAQLNNLFDPKEYLTGTAYDPEIIKQIHSALQQGYALTAQGASTPEVMMVLGPQVAKLNAYAANAKQINQNIKLSAERLKPYKGYNAPAAVVEARKLAMLNPDGTLKDPSMVDPNRDYVTEAIHQFPERTTTYEGIDDFVKNTPMSEAQLNGTKSFGGVTTRHGYTAKMHPWQDFIRDENGNIKTDLQGNELGLGVESDIHKDKEGNVFRVMNQPKFNAIMKYNPDIADRIRGDVKEYFKQAGGEAPDENTPEWDLAARDIMRQHLEDRNKSTFKINNEVKKADFKQKQEAGVPLHYGKEQKEVKKGILD